MGRCATRRGRSAALGSDAGYAAEVLRSRLRGRDRLGACIGRLRGRTGASATRRSAPRSTLGTHRAAYAASGAGAARPGGKRRRCEGKPLQRVAAFGCLTRQSIIERPGQRTALITRVEMAMTDDNVA